MSSAPLYALTSAYQQLLELADAGEDITAELAAIDEKIEAKAVNICKLLAQFDADEAAALAESKRLAGRAKVAANAAEKLRAYVKDNMKAANITKIKSPVFSITLSAGTPRVLIIDLMQIPRDLVSVEVVRTPDKRAILAEFKRDGVVPPGCDIQETHKLTVR